MKDIVNALHGIVDALPVTYVTNEVFNFGIFIELPHVILFLFIAAENSYLLISVFKNRLKTAFPKEPVPPVISKHLLLKSISIFLVTVDFFAT